MTKVALGGSCHWCMEAIYQSLIGVTKVEQGFVASKEIKNTFSEAIIVHFNPDEIPLKVLIEIHLNTHKSTVNHSRRYKYFSAVYAFSEMQLQEVKTILKQLQANFSEKIITKAYLFAAFELSEERNLNYYYSNPEKPFCSTYINPKLKLLLANYGKYTNKNLKKFV